MDDKNTEPKPVFTARKRFFRKKWFIIVGIVTLVLIVAGGVFFVFLTRSIIVQIARKKLHKLQKLRQRKETIFPVRQNL